MTGGWIFSFYRSTIGKKIVMAVTGVILVGFLIGHVSGNLLVYQGAEALNHYAAFLKSSKPILWGVRSVLLISVILHIHAALTLTVQAKRARPDGYEQLATQADTWSARTMRVGGILLLGFIVFHLLHFTTGTVHPAFSPENVYGNVIVGFQVPWVTGFYIVAMLALGMHLHHGVWSLFQTLGVNHPHVNTGRRRLAAVLALLVATGFIAIPVGVLVGVLK